MFVYVAYPYGRSRNLSLNLININVQASIEIGRRLILKGHIPFVANLYHFVHEGWEDSPEEPVWFDIASSWVRKCDALYFGGGSTGTNAERRIAFGLRLPIYYSLDEVPCIS